MSCLPPNIEHSVTNNVCITDTHYCDGAPCICISYEYCEGERSAHQHHTTATMQTMPSRCRPRAWMLQISTAFNYSSGCWLVTVSHNICSHPRYHLLPRSGLHLPLPVEQNLAFILHFIIYLISNNKFPLLGVKLSCVCLMFAGSVDIVFILNSIGKLSWIIVHAKHCLLQFYYWIKVIWKKIFNIHIHIIVIV